MSPIGRALRGRVARTALTAGGVAATTHLVLVLLAANRSLAAGVNAYAGQRQIDMWIAPPGVDNLIRSTGLLPPGTEEAVSSVKGVAAADPVLRSFVTVEPPDRRRDGGGRGERRLTLLAIGFAAPAGLGGPPAIAGGRAPSEPQEVAIDRAAAHRLRVRPGDSVRVNGRSAHLVGLTRGTNLLATQFLFSDVEGARDAGGLPGRASFLAVGVMPGEDPAAIARVIRARVPEVSVIDRSTFVANNLREVASGLLPLLGLVAALGLSVAAVLVVLLVQGLVEDRRLDIAVLLALGADAAAIGAGLVIRAALLVASGGAIGGLLTVAMAALLDRIAPHVELTYAAGHFALVLALFVSAGAIAAAGPVLRLRRIDPLEAFRP